MNNQEIKPQPQTKTIESLPALQEYLVGKTIKNVEMKQNSFGIILNLVLHFDDGTQFAISPSNLS